MKLSKQELKEKISNLEISEDLQIELLEDIEDSMLDIKDNSKEMEELKQKYEDLRTKYKERFLGIEIKEEEIEEPKEEKIIEKKDIFKEKEEEN